jgi:hypothetical protein
LPFAGGLWDWLLLLLHLANSDYLPALALFFAVSYLTGVSGAALARLAVRERPSPLARSGEALSVVGLALCLATIFGVTALVIAGQVTGTIRY